MGVAGVGKSSVGAALAARLSVRFVDGDDLHPVENIAKMKRGIPLTDDDRWPWLRAVGDELASAARQRDSVLIACSALRRRYRDVIVSRAPETVFVCLTAPADVVAQRMAARTGHFMPAALLDSQFAELELPNADERASLVDVSGPLDSVVAQAVAGLIAALNPDRR